MLKKFKKEKQNTQKIKGAITISRTLASVLAPGMPVTYLYQGHLIRTSAVEAILEASQNHVQFETKNSLYTLFFNNSADTSVKQIA